MRLLGISSWVWISAAGLAALCHAALIAQGAA
jgi:hypothetical protein